MAGTETVTLLAESEGQRTRSPRSWPIGPGRQTRHKGYYRQFPETSFARPYGAGSALGQCKELPKMAALGAGRGRHRRPGSSTRRPPEGLPAPSQDARVRREVPGVDGAIAPLERSGAGGRLSAGGPGAPAERGRGASSAAASQSAVGAGDSVGGAADSMVASRPAEISGTARRRASPAGASLQADIQPWLVAGPLDRRNIAGRRLPGYRRPRDRHPGADQRRDLPRQLGDRHRPVRPDVVRPARPAPGQEPTSLGAA